MMKTAPHLVGIGVASHDPLVTLYCGCGWTERSEPADLERSVAAHEALEPFGVAVDEPLLPSLGPLPAYRTPAEDGPVRVSEPSCDVLGCTRPAPLTYTADADGDLAGWTWKRGDLLHFCRPHAANLYNGRDPLWEDGLPPINVPLTRDSGVSRT